MKNKLLPCLMPSLFILFILSGCSNRGDIYKIKTGYGSNSYFYHHENTSLSFIKDSLPNKTYLTIVDIPTRKIKKYYFAGYGFDGPHELIPRLNQAVISAFFVKGGVGQSKLLIIDLKKKAIMHSFHMPSDCQVMLIKKPAWSQKIYVLFQMMYEKKTLLKTIDLHNNSISDAKIIGNFFTKNAFFIDDTPYLILDTLEDSKTQLVIYALDSNNILHAYDTTTNFADIDESNEKSIIYGLIQAPGDNKGKVLKFNINNKSEQNLTELDGELESLQVVNNLLYIISKDLKRTDKQKKYWLCPRNLYVFNTQNFNTTDVIDWTQRNGKFIGFSDERNEVYYTVVDNDAPALCIIKNFNRNLLKIRHSIR